MLADRCSGVVKNVVLLSFICFSLTASSQNFQAKFMYWNLLNYPDPLAVSSDTSLRNPYYRTVVQYVNPDVLITGENTMSSSPDFFLNQVLNVNGVVYAKGVFVTGPDTNNEIYFKQSSFAFIGNKPIHTNLRDINEFTLVYIPTLDTIRIYAVHLKASSGSPNDGYRASEVDSLRKVTNKLQVNSNFIICGDFNIYGSLEAAYSKLLQDNLNDDGNVVDPISMTGTWNNGIYAANHTQSTRTVGFGGGASGGLNDRFDMILFSNAVDQGLNNIHYVSGSTKPIGNDSSHYNQSIITMPNTSAPSNVISALYNASDHLPIVAEFLFTNPTQTFEPNRTLEQLKLFPNPCRDILTVDFENKLTGTVVINLYDLLGKLVFSSIHLKDSEKIILNDQKFKNLRKGLYFISAIQNDIEHHSKFAKE